MFGNRCNIPIPFMGMRNSRQGSKGAVPLAEAGAIH